MMRELSRREFIKFASAGIAAATAGAGSELCGAADRKRRPNVLYVFADQMRAAAMGCMGNTCVKTPNLDALAGQGLLLTNAMSCSPVCSPYRAQLMTGRYGHTTGVIHNDIKLPNTETTLPEMLKRAGYSTGYIGKWHLNGDRSGFVKPEDRQGWDYWAALACSHQYFKTRYFRDTPEPIPINGYEPDVQTDLAIEFIKQNRDRPFCLAVSFGPPHNPYRAPAKFDIYDPAKLPLRPNVPPGQAEKWRPQIAQYYGLVTSLDANIARMMKALETLGIAEDTIFCFSSDHGDMLGSQGHRLKQRPWEESVNVPFIMRYPRRLGPGRKSDVLLASVDVMPTLLGFCGATVPAGVQGRDLSGVLAGDGGDEPTMVYFANTHRGGGPGTDWRGIRTKRWKYAYHAKGDWVLYDLAADPYEMNNLIGDPKYKAKRDELRALLDARRKELGDKAELVGQLAPTRAKPRL